MTMYSVEVKRKMKKSNMKHNPKLHRKFFMLLRTANGTDQKADLVNRFTEGRTNSSREMTDEEITKAIEYIEFMIGGMEPSEDFKRGDRMRKRIMSLCHQYGYTRYDEKKRKNVVDLDRLESWMIKYSYLHKSLNKYKYKELPRLVVQFQNVVYSYLNQI